MNVYENIVIFDGSLSDEAIEESTKKITDLITGHEGEVLKVDHWGRRRMAYEINRHSRGYYTLFLFKAPGGLIKKMEVYYRITDSVVKFMVVALEKKQKEAALRAVQKEKEAASSQEKEAAASQEKEAAASQEKEAAASQEKEAAASQGKEAVAGQEKEAAASQEKEAVAGQEKEAASSQEKEAASGQEKEAKES